MTTEAQIKANQENAKKSTGPTSTEGKQRSSMNAITHGIFSKIHTLPGEDQEFFKVITDQIYEAYKPQDAMEIMLVERIIEAYLKQVRLRAAEAAHIRINMTEERLTERLNIALEVPYLERFTFNDLSPEKEEHYQFFLKVIEEFKIYDQSNFDFSIETIKNKMPNTFGLLTQKPKEYKTTWEHFIERPESIKLGMKEIKEGVTKYLEKNKFAHTAFYFLEEIKAMQRLPVGNSFDLFNKYQSQFDNDFYRAMKMFKEYRNSKPIFIECEIIKEKAA